METIILTLLSTLLGIAVGGLITWWAAKHYYKQASRDLAEEAKELKDMNTLILQSLEQSGAKFARDDKGNITSIQFTGIGNGQLGAVTGNGRGTFVPPQSSKAD